MKNNFNITLGTTIIALIITVISMPFGIFGFISGILYAQIIEWFVHGWIQHYPFKIFRAYRKAHNYHHAKPNEPRSVQPVQYFIFGSVLLLLPFYWFGGFYAGYFFMYAMINIIHYDLHSKNKLLPKLIWKSGYFKLIEKHHYNHHKGYHHGQTTHSVTNPYMDSFFYKIKITHMNNYIARKLKI